MGYNANVNLENNYYSAKQKKNISAILPLVISLVIFICTSLFLFNFFKYQINSDAIEYISISLKYSHQDFFSAINGYRSPMFSWLLIPFLYLPIEPLFSIKILNIIIGICVISMLERTAFKSGVDFTARLIFSVSLVPLILFFIFSVTTPDLLSALFLILAFYLLKNYKMEIKTSIIFGVITAFAYYTKAFNLYFLVLILVIFLITDLITKNTSFGKAFLNFIIALGVTAALILPWVILLSIKYQHFTISTIGLWDLKLFSPEASVNSEIITQHLKQPNGVTGFMMDDSSLLVDKLRYSFNLKFYIINFIRNFYNYIKEFDKFYFTVLFIFYLVFYKKNGYLNSFKTYVFFIIYIAGYSLIVFEPRLMTSLVILAFFLIITAVLESRELFKKTGRLYFYYVLIIVISISFIYEPIINIKNNYQAFPGKESYVLATQIREEIKISGNVAASSKGRNILYIVYYNRDKLKYFGTTKIDKELKEFNIDYYFIYKDNSDIINEMDLYKKDKIGNFGDYIVYKIR